MPDLGSTLYRRRGLVLTVLLGAAVLVTVCLLVSRVPQALAPVIWALR